MIDPDTPLPFWGRVVPPAGGPSHLVRSGWLTPYTVETLVEDTLRMGTGGRLLVTVPATTSEWMLGKVRERLTRAGGRGVEVNLAGAPAAP